MTIYIPPELTEQFIHFGSNTYIQKGGLIESPEQVSIGNNVSIHAPYSLTSVIVSEGVPLGVPAISIGDGCKISGRLQISPRNKVILEPNVLIHSNVRIEGEITVGEGSWIGANCQLSGNIRIGAGSVVKANSMVLDNVPDYCVVSGNPAAVVHIYDTSSCDWVEVSDNEQAQALLMARSHHPLLSICIPTFNRAPYLDVCLQSIFSQIGNNELIEVVVSDNASTDATPEVISKYKALYPNMRTTRNETTISGDANILHVITLGRGKFLKMQGDDDYFVAGTILPLLNVLHNHPECGVIHISVINGNRPLWLNSGMSNYLAATNLYAAFITSVILRREDFEQVEHPTLFVSSCFNQLYLQYSVLEINPQFCIMYNSMFTYGGGAGTEKYIFAEVYFNSYPSILSHFLGKGFTAEEIAREKRQALYNYAIPWFRNNKATATIDEFEGVYTKYYQDEPYYEEALAIITAIRQA